MLHLPFPHRPGRKAGSMYVSRETSDVSRELSDGGILMLYI
jgi:hypothetical protein